MVPIHWVPSNYPGFLVPILVGSPVHLQTGAPVQWWPIVFLHLYREERHLCAWQSAGHLDGRSHFTFTTASGPQGRCNCPISPASRPGFRGLSNLAWMAQLPGLGIQWRSAWLQGLLRVLCIVSAFLSSHAVLAEQSPDFNMTYWLH